MHSLKCGWTRHSQSQVLCMPALPRNCGSVGGKGSKARHLAAVLKEEEVARAHFGPLFSGKSRSPSIKVYQATRYRCHCGAPGTFVCGIGFRVIRQT